MPKNKGVNSKYTFRRHLKHLPDFSGLIAVKVKSVAKTLTVFDDDCCVSTFKH